MKKLILISLLICTPAYAEKVRVFTDYSPVRVMRLTDKNINFEVEANKAGLSGNFKDMEESDLPQDRADRDAWKVSGGKVVVDSKIKADLDKIKQDKLDEKQAVINKLVLQGFSEKEAKLLMGEKQ